MIAEILQNSENFHAVRYNDLKVSKGEAKLLEMKNFGSVGLFNKPTTEEKIKYLQFYTSMNDRIKKAQFHVTISCKGQEMSESELLEFTHKYLKEMGYGDPEQPLLIYSHYDTDNNHIHAVTSRIDPNGRKIEHDHERRRSKAVIDNILGRNNKQKTEEDFNTVKNYTFSTIAQFKAALSSCGYKAYKKDNMLCMVRNGVIQKKIPLEEIESLYKNRYRNVKRCRQLRSILKKYRDISSNKTEFKKELKKKFGIDIVFFGRRDKPYGYMIVDHANKIVINGNRVLALDQLLDFSTPEQRLNRIEDFIDRILTLNPKATQWDINEKLRYYHAFYKKGIVYCEDGQRVVQPLIAEAINRNNRIEWIEKFKPTNQAEINLLCKIYKADCQDIVSMFPLDEEASSLTVNRLQSIFNDKEATSTVKQRLFEAGFFVRKENDSVYAISFKDFTIVNLSEKGFDIKKLQVKPHKQKSATKKNRNTISKGKLLGVQGGSHSDNREWEVGNKSNYDTIDDGRTLRR